jgi:hypothetical protein
MPEIVTVKNLTVTTGSTINIPVDLASGFLDSQLHGYRLTGSPTLSVADYVLVPQGTAILNQRVVFYWEANVTYGVGTAIIIFGKTVPSAWATKNFIATCVYDGSAWQVQLVCGGEEDGWIETADIADEAVTVDKMADLARGHLLIGNSSTRPVAVDFNNSGYIGIGDGTDYNSVAQSGDVIFSNAGVAAIQPGVIVNADVNASAAIDFSKLAALSSGKILVGSAGNVATAVTPVGDVTITAAGGTVIGAAKVTTSMLASAAKVELINFTVDFTDFGSYNLTLPYACTIVNIRTSCSTDSTGAGNGLLRFQINSVAGALTHNGATTPDITLSHADNVGASQLVTSVANNTCIADDYLIITTADSGGITGGKYLVSMKVTRV